MDKLNSDSLAPEPSSNVVSIVNFAKQSINGNDSHCSQDAGNDQECLELFQCALIQNDQVVQRNLQRRFKEVVLNWMRQHPRGNVACHLNDEEYYVNQAFEHFWRAGTRHLQVESATLTAIMLYLRVCLNAAILEAFREFTRAKVIAMPNSGAANEDHDTSHQIWQIVQRLLPNKREQRMAYLLFHCGFKPDEIANSWPHEFADISEIARLRRKIVELLRNG
jgi:hypothetical protein